MKKLLVTLLTIVMVLSIAIPAFADETSNVADVTGSITLNKVMDGADYGVYRLLDLVYNEDKTSYTYTIAAGWEGFFATSDAKTYFAVSSNNENYVSWIGGDSDEAPAEFAKLALAYAKANDIAPTQVGKVENGVAAENTQMKVEVSATGSVTGKFDNLPLGYYLVDSSIGALCSLKTTDPNAYLEVKNGVPTVDKQVQEDSTENWGNTNSADIGQTVNFRTTITVHAGAENYVLHDTMSAGLTFTGVTKIEVVIPQVSTTDITSTEGTNFEVVTDGLTSGCTFEVVFSDDFCDTLDTNTRLVVYYSAVINENAVINGEGNPNETWLEYGDHHLTTHDKTQTYTYRFDVVKTDGTGELLNGAEFDFYSFIKKEGGVKEYTLFNLIWDENLDAYRPAKTGETGSSSIVVTDGYVKIIGLDNGDYAIKETEAPVGYQIVDKYFEITISDSNHEAQFDADNKYTIGGINVVNQAGTKLPETGGTGTVIFVTLGAIAMLGTGVLLFAKKRMSQIAE